MNGILKQLRGDSVLSVPTTIQSLGPSVEALFALCGPSAILRRVGAAIIAPIYRVFRGGFIAHVREESVEGCSPSLANVDAAPSIVCEGFIARVFASHFQRNPRSIFSRVHGLTAPTALPVFCQGVVNAFQSETSTRNHQSLRKVARAYISLLSAITLATPVRITPTGWQFKQRHQSPEPNAGVIALTSHSHEYSAMVLVP